MLSPLIDHAPGSLIGAVFAAGAAIVGAIFLRPQPQPAMHGAPATESA